MIALVPISTGIGSTCGPISISTHHHLYVNNASKIAPFCITGKPLLSTNHDNNDDSHKKHCFEEQLCNVILEILPPSFWNTHHMNTHMNGNVNVNVNANVNVAKCATGDMMKMQAMNNRNHHVTPYDFCKRFQIQPLNGGLSNHLFTVTNRNTNDTVLVRIHPPSSPPSSLEESKVETDHDEEFVLVNREYENQIVSFLSKHQMGPLFYGRFQNGRIEEFYKGYRTIQYHEMAIPKYARGIAIQMSNLHSLPLDELEMLGDKCISGNAIQSQINGMSVNSSDNHNNNGYDGGIWERIDSWLDMSKQLLSRSDITTKDILALKPLVDTIDTEWEWYKQEMRKQQYEQETTNSNAATTTSSIQLIQQKAIEFCREVVFTHMDCQSLNILTSDNNDNESNTKDRKEEKSADVRLIDFEYASFDRRAIDIANTFLEHCDMNNLKPNYETEYPTKEEQNLFLITYLRQCCNNSDDFQMIGEGEKLIIGGVSKEQSLLSLYDWMFSGKEGDDEAELTTDQELLLGAIRIEIAKHTLFSHLEWSCWSIIQSMQCVIDFDYVKYAKLRMEGYYHFKKMYC